MIVDSNSIEKKSTILVILSLIILTLGVYWPVQNYEFLSYDDQLYVTDIYSQKDTITFKDISGTFSDVHTGHWHPLTSMSHMLDWYLFKNNAGGHHWTNVIIHIFNTILLFLLFRTMTGSLWRSAFVAALFAVHPINLESVAWIAERKNVLSTFFWILTMLLYVRYVAQPDWKRYLPVFLCFVLGLMSKPMLVTLPFVLLLLDYWPLNRTTINTQNDHQIESSRVDIKKRKISILILEKVPLFVLSAVSIVLTLYAARSAKTIVTLDSLPLINRISNAVVAYIMYIKKLFWPADLAVIYPYVATPVWQILMMITLLVIITICVCKYLLKYPYLAVGWFWYAGTLVPVIGIIQAGDQSMADRYAYIPFIGLFMMIVWGMGYVFKKIFSAKVIAGISGAILVALIIVSCHQVRYWQNTFTLFSHAVKVTRNNAIAHRILADELINQNKLKEAMHHCEIGLSLNPANHMMLVSMAWAYYLLDEKNKAIDTLRRAIKVHPEYFRAYNDLFVFLRQADKAEEGLKEYQKATELDCNKDSWELHYYFGKALASEGYFDEAISQYNQVLRIHPRNDVAHDYLALLLLRQGKIDDALNHLREAGRLQPKFARAHYRLALIFKQKRLFEEDNLQYQEATRLPLNMLEDYKK
jgi:tetratricopeptide (TPR) repeat protein